MQAYLFITKTSPCNKRSLSPTLYAKNGIAGVNIIFVSLFFALNIDGGPFCKEPEYMFPLNEKKNKFSQKH